MGIVEEINILNDFKTLTDSSCLPIGLKDRFMACADADINEIVSGVIV